MLVNFIYFYKKNIKENISKNAENLTNEVREFFWQEKVKLENYPSYDFIKKI